MQVNMRTFSDRLQARRSELNLSQAALAEKSSISLAALSKYERGVTTPRKSAFLKLAEALQCTPEWLENGVAIEEKEEVVPYSLLMPSSVVDRLFKVARENSRDPNQELIHRLEESFSAINVSDEIRAKLNDMAEQYGISASDVIANLFASVDQLERRIEKATVRLRSTLVHLEKQNTALYHAKRQRSEMEAEMIAKYENDQVRKMALELGMSIITSQDAFQAMIDKGVVTVDSSENKEREE